MQTGPVDILLTLYPMVFGLGVGAGLYTLVLYRKAHFWRKLADIYGSDWRPAPMQKHMRQGALYGTGIAFQSYSGILSIGVHPDGLALKVMLPFSAFHPPLFVPFKEISGWKQDWYLNGESTELSFRQAPDVRFVLPAEDAHWIQDASRGRLSLNHQGSTYASSAPGLSRAIALTALLSIGLLALVYVTSVPEFNF